MEEGVNRKRLREDNTKYGVPYGREHPYEHPFRVDFEVDQSPKQLYQRDLVEMSTEQRARKS